MAFRSDVNQLVEKIGQPPGVPMPAVRRFNALRAYCPQILSGR